MTTSQFSVNAISICSHIEQVPMPIPCPHCQLCPDRLPASMEHKLLQYCSVGRARCARRDEYICLNSRQTNIRFSLVFQKPLFTQRQRCERVIYSINVHRPDIVNRICQKSRMFFSATQFTFMSYSNTVCDAIVSCKKLVPK